MSFSQNSREPRQQFDHEVYVKNLPFTATSEDIKAFFESAGAVDSINLMTGYGGRSKGVAFVRFTNPTDVQKAVAKNGSDFGGRPVAVEKTTTRDEREGDDRRGGYRGGYRGGQSRGGYSNNNNDDDDEEEKNEGGSRENHNYEAYVTNLPFTANQDDIRDFFGRDVESVNLLRGYNGKSKGIAFVRFTNDGALRKAIEMNGRNFDGRDIEVEKTKPRNQRDDFRPRFNSGRGGYRDDYRGGSRYGGNPYGGGDRYGGDRYGGYGGDRYGDNRYGGDRYGGDRYGGNDRYGGGDRYGGDRYRDDQYRGGDRYRDDRFKDESKNQGSTESSSIFVGDLSYSTTNESLRDFFADCGRVLEATVSRHYDGKSKGFGHVDFESNQAAQRAMKLTGQELDGRAIRVDFSSGKRTGGGGRGGFSGGRGGFGGGRGGYGYRD